VTADRLREDVAGQPGRGAAAVAPEVPALDVDPWMFSGADHIPVPEAG
jgi:hypothetical protein